MALGCLLTPDKLRQQIKPIIFSRLLGLSNEASQNIKVSCSSGTPGTAFCAEGSQTSCQEAGLPGKGLCALFKERILHKSGSTVWPGRLFSEDEEDGHVAETRQEVELCSETVLAICPV